jgi:hypothetical protein
VKRRHLSAVVRDIGSINAALIVAVLVYALEQAVAGDEFHLADGSVSAQAADLLAFSVLCGFASYATIETLKRVVRVRGWYQLVQTKRWLDATGRRHAGFVRLLRALGVRNRWDEALRVFNLPIEQLAAQISAAADVALAAPRRYRPLIESLAAPLPRELAEYLQSQQINGSAGKETSERERELAFQLAQRMRIGIDRLQISLGERWRRAVQGAALWFAGGYAIALLHAGGLGGRSEPRYVLAGLLLGGPLAWVFRDIAALLERARR